MYTDKVSSKSVFYLESPSTESKPHDRRVTFWYHMKLRDTQNDVVPDGTLSIEYYGDRDQTVGWHDMPGSYFPAWSKTGYQGSDWLEGFAILPTNATRMRFKTVAGDLTKHGDSYDIAVDDVKLINDPLPSVSFSCSFEESSLCGWTSFTKTELPASFMWTWQTGTTASKYSGPSSAQQGSYYMYTDKVSSNSVFYLESPSTQSKPHDRRVTFWYHMTLRDERTYAVVPDGTLSIEYYGDRDQTVGWHDMPGSSFPAWSKTGYQGSDWLEGFAILPASATRIVMKELML